MTASTRQGRAAMRVQVSHVPWENSAFPWVRTCGGCKERTGYWRNQDVAMEYAVEHAATCPALRLAALVRELEKLRDGWHERASRSTDEWDPDYAFEIASVTLERLLTEALNA